MEMTVQMREQLHEKLMRYWTSREAAAKRGIRAPGLDLTDSELMAMLRLTRARAATE